MPLHRRTLLLASAGTLAMPWVARAADTIRIGVVSPLTGPAAEPGGFMRTGIQIALDEVNEAGVLGRKVETVVADDQTTNPGAVLAFSLLSSDPAIVGFIGSTRSTQVMAMAPDVLKVGKPMMFGGTDPKLTHMGNPWLFRCRPNDIYSTKAIASFGSETLGKKQWAFVYSTDSFGTGGRDAFLANLKTMGLEPAVVQGYTNQQADFTPVVLAVRSSSADILCTYFTYEADLGIFARQVRQLGIRLPWVGSTATVSIPAMNLAGPALYGSYGAADFAVDANPVAEAFAAKYQALRHVVPDQAWAYDATKLLCHAIGKAGSTEPNKIRTAIIATHGYIGCGGEFDFDENGDGLHGYNIVRNENGKIVFNKHFEFPAV